MKCWRHWTQHRKKSINKPEVNKKRYKSVKKHNKRKTKQFFFHLFLQKTIYCEYNTELHRVWSDQWDTQKKNNRKTSLHLHYLVCIYGDSSTSILYFINQFKYSILICLCFSSVFVIIGRTLLHYCSCKSKIMSQVWVFSIPHWIWI